MNYILISEKTKKFKDTNRFDALKKARNFLYPEKGNCEILYPVLPEKLMDEYREVGVDNNNKVYIFAHKSDFEPINDKSVDIKTPLLLEIKAKKNIKIVFFSGATNGATIDLGTNCSRVFAINCGIQNPIFDTKEEWVNILQFLDNESERPTVIAREPIPAHYAAALILLRGYELISKKEYCKDQQIGAIVAQTQRDWSNATEKQKEKYWAPIAENKALLTEFCSLQKVIDGNVSDQDITCALEEINKQMERQ